MRLILVEGFLERYTWGKEVVTDNALPTSDDPGNVAWCGCSAVAAPLAVRRSTRLVAANARAETARLQCVFWMTSVNSAFIAMVPGSGPPHSSSSSGWCTTQVRDLDGRLRLHDIFCTPLQSYPCHLKRGLSHCAGTCAGCPSSRPNDPGQAARQQQPSMDPDPKPYTLAGSTCAGIRTRWRSWRTWSWPICRRTCTCSCAIRMSTSPSMHPGRWQGCSATVCRWDDGRMLGQAQDFGQGLVLATTLRSMHPRRRKGCAATVYRLVGSQGVGVARLSSAVPGWELCCGSGLRSGCQCKRLTSRWSPGNILAGDALMGS